MRTAIAVGLIICIGIPLFAVAPATTVDIKNQVHYLTWSIVEVVQTMAALLLRVKEENVSPQMNMEIDIAIERLYGVLIVLSRMYE